MWSFDSNDNHVTTWNKLKAFFSYKEEAYGIIILELIIYK